MPVYGFNDRKTAEKLRQLVSGPERRRSTISEPRQIFRQQRPIVFENTESVTMPAYACLFSTGAVLDDTGEWKVPVHQGKRANTTDSTPYMVLLNNPRDVEAGERGSAQQDDFQIALYDSESPADVATPLGPIEGQWYLAKNPIFVTHRFVADLGDGLMLVRESKPSDFFRVIMQWNGTGGNGSSTAANDYRYNISTIDGILLEADVQLNRDSRHDYWTWELGEVDPATSGTAYFDNQGRLIIHDCNEHLRLGECSSP